MTELGVGIEHDKSLLERAMDSVSEAAAQAVESRGVPPSSLPWGQIPVFQPGVTDIRVYTRKLQFLREIWPVEHVEHLAPRAALMIEGAAFQKIARLDPSKLRDKNGVKVLVETLGGQWGRLEVEDKFDLFERALYQTVQKGDESNDSYLTRHDVAFEDLLTKKVTLEDIRAYILVRQSQLSPEDRKRIIVECQGDLTYEKARRSLRLLGSRFFNDLQNSSRQNKMKTYDINTVDDEPMDGIYSASEHEEIDEEQVFQALAEEGDVDAVYVQDFEEQVILACQENSELASCFATYQEARQKLREKARFRGFWPLTGSKGKKGKGKGKFRSTSSWTPTSSSGGSAFRKKSLAERIANSTCRRCGQAGHWKRECPLAARDGKEAGETVTMAEMAQSMPEIEEYLVLDDLPAGAVPYANEEDTESPNVGRSSCMTATDAVGVGEKHDQDLASGRVEEIWFVLSEMKVQQGLVARLSAFVRERCTESATAHRAEPIGSTPESREEGRSLSIAEDTSPIFHAEEGQDLAIVDTGASRTIVGDERLHEILRNVPAELRRSVMKVPSEGITFKFGNSGRLTSTHGILFPRSKGGWIRLEVVPGRTPCLISNGLLKRLRLLVDPVDKCLVFKDSYRTIPLHACRKELLAVSLMDLLQSDTPHMSTQDVLAMSHEVHVQTPILPPMKNVQFTDKSTHDDVPCTEPKPVVIEPKVVSSADREDLREFEGCHGIHSTTTERSSTGTSSSTPPSAREHPVEQSCAYLIHDGNDYQATGSPDPPRLGATRLSQRQDEGHDLCSGVRERARVCEAGGEPQGGIGMAMQFSAVCSSTPRGQPGFNRPDEGDSGASPQLSAERGDPEQDDRGEVPEDAGELPGYRGLDPYLGRRDQLPPRAEAAAGTRSQSAEPHEERAEPRASAESSHPDRHSGARPRAGGAGAGGRGTIDREIEKAARYVEGNDRVRGSGLGLDGIVEQLEVLTAQIEGELKVMPSPQGRRTHQKSVGHSGFRTQVRFMEVYCNMNSQLCSQMNGHGIQAVRFTKADGDLSTEQGRERLWSWVQHYEPEHIWVAPECRFWGNYSRYNMGLGTKSCARILEEREHDRVHLELCNQLYMYQVGEGKHFHLEQPQGSEMMGQEELVEARLGTLPATFDMCKMGRLHLPQETQYIRKRTTVYTTSRIVFNALQEQMCDKQHVHRHIRGKEQIHGRWLNISTFAQSYTPTFARRVARMVVQSLCGGEKPLVVDEMVLGLDEHERPEMAQDALRVQKRRRVHFKQAPEALYGKAPSWEAIFKTVSARTPRVGNGYFRLGEPVTELVQKLVPDMEVRLLVACRGTDRHRVLTPTTGDPVYPFRKTVVVDRHTGEVRETGPVEPWTQLPRIQQIRSTGPAKLSLTIFGTKRGEESAGEQSGSGLSKSVGSAGNGECARKGPLILSEGTSVPVEASVQGLATTRVPVTVPTSGPDFRRLSAEQKQDLRRLHNNLGHPDPEKFRRFLQERGADEEVLKGAGDMACDTCLENQPHPKLPHPSHIHENYDFNDLVGMDGAHWSNKHGKTFHFTHYIDEGTLFHLGTRCGRSVPDQIRAFEETWLRWAGPCKRLYMDPAGEFTNDEWATFLQSEGIACSVAASRSHWQIGRSEVHGKIVKTMLSHMELDRAIDTEEEFDRCLRQAFNAKNSLSRAYGFTPEQALLGKARSLPGSLTGDASVASHELVDSQTPEGIRFREDLQRRETARRAFVRADNDSAFRRALLRRSRPGQFQWEAGDWILYWKKDGSKSRLVKGRWHGPAQVISVERGKIVWVSHCGRLIRASPQHLRPASLREYSRIPKGSDGLALDETPLGKGFIELDDFPDEVASETRPSSLYSPSLAEQPEGEQFPSDHSDRQEPVGADLDEAEEKVEASDVPVPEGNGSLDGGSEDELFGDSVTCATTPEVIEIHLSHEWSGPLEDDEVLSHSVEAWQILLATPAKKDRSEVKFRDLTDRDRELFEKAKAKEVKAWLDHKTVARVAGGTLKPEQIMRSRWILTWKDPLPGTTERRAKARIVVLGFEDPGIGKIPSDAPTLGKDARQLLLQQVASRGWRLVNFDISTAFLRGESDGRPLGLHAPVEIQKALQMRPGDQCSLNGGAYGRVDAPYLWYQSLRKTLEDIGFIACPLDGCLFSLISPGPNGSVKVHGVLGVHVDDGIGGGDTKFARAIQLLREKYSFGSYDEGEFDFCGVHYKQWDDGSIELDQRKYIDRIQPANIPRDRRAEPAQSVNDMERHALRQLCGSLQYAVVHSRPDLAAKVGILQSSVPHAKVEDLIEANRVLYEAKTHPVCIMVVPIEESRVCFCCFSDASFATGKSHQSRQGTLIVATDVAMDSNQRVAICSMAWSSRKIPRVVTSTLSAETIALSSALDRLGYIRVMWEWFRNPGINWVSPEEVLATASRSLLVTDCKSAYDIACKTAPPVCSEYRTSLECLSLRERLRDNVSLRWVSSKAQLADCLTKAMEAGHLRACLESGKYCLYDEEATLKDRATRRARLQWLKGTNASSGNV